MPSSLTTLLIVAIACLLLGGIAGMLITSLLGGSEEESDDIQQEAPPGGKKGRYEPVVRLWREKSTEMLIVEMDGKSYLSPDPVRIDQRERLEQAARDFAGWAGISLPNAGHPPQAPVPAQPAPQQAMHVNNVVLQPASSREQPPANASTAAPVPQQVIREQPPARPVIGSKPSAPVNPPPGVVDKAPKTMVQQIDVILKEMAAGTPMEMHGLALTEDLRRGVIVWVGAVSYEGIGSVPDPEIQKFVRAAVAEWERREDEASKARQKRT